MVNVDTKLLVIFTELLSKRNATYVAEKMHMTAPAVSHSLGRLREIFDDPLFIRVPHGLTPTPRALELGPKIRDMLDLWTSINEGDADNFDPASPPVRCISVFPPNLATRFSIASCCASSNSRRTCTCARWSPIPGGRHRRDASERAGPAFSPYPTRHPEIVEEMVSSLNLWVCARSQHPVLKGGCTLDQYLDCSHIFMAPSGSTGRAAPSLIPLDYALQQRGLKRNATLTVHSRRAQAELAAQTDMIFTVNALTKDMACGPTA